MTFCNEDFLANFSLIFIQFRHEFSERLNIHVGSYKNPRLGLRMSHSLKQQFIRRTDLAHVSIV